MGLNYWRSKAAASSEVDFHYFLFFFCFFFLVLFRMALVWFFRFPQIPLERFWHAFVLSFLIFFLFMTRFYTSHTGLEYFGFILDMIEYAVRLDTLH